MTIRCLKWNFIETDLSYILSEESPSYGEKNSSFGQEHIQTSHKHSAQIGEIHQSPSSHHTTNSYQPFES